MEKVKSIVLNSSYKISITTNMVNSIEEFCEDNGRNQQHAEYMKVLTSIYYSYYLNMSSKKYDQFGISIYHNILYKLFGKRNYLKVKSDCFNTTLNYFNNYDFKTGRMSSYKLKVDVLDGEIIRIHPKTPSNFIEKHRNRLIKGYNTGYQHDLVLGDRRNANTNDFLLSIKPYYENDECKSLINKLYYAGVFHGKQLSAKQLNDKNLSLIDGFTKCGEHFSKKPDANGRVYSIFSMTKREIRGIFKDDLVEVDISNSHPFILTTIINYLKDSSSRKINQKSNFIGVLKQQLENLIQHTPDELKKVHAEEIFNWDLTNLNNLQLINKLSDSNNQLSYNSNYNILNSLIIISYLYHILNNNSILYSGTPFLDHLSEETEIVAKQCQNSTFYEFVLKENLDDLLLFYKRRRSLGAKYLSLKPEEITQSIRKKIIKRSVMYWFNDKVSDKRDNTDFFRNALPNIDELIIHLKETFGQLCIHTLVSSVESNFVFDVTNQCYRKSATRGTRPFLVGTLHDAFYVPQEKVSFLHQVIQKKGKKHFDVVPPFKTVNIEEEYLAEIDLSNEFILTPNI